MDKPSSRDLILQLQAGSLEALGELYDRYQALVYRTALVITNDSNAAEDLLQDVFLRLHRFADRIDPQRPLEPWLYRMTANLSYTWVKRSRRWYRPLEDLAEWLVGGEKNSPQEQIEQDDDWEQVQRAVSSLPLQQRVVGVLYYLNDLSLQEISDILDVPVGTVKSRLHYGRMALKLKLGLDNDILPDLNHERP
ncbi:MAG: sigma-70 family RNA polymerase sigma factor [Chloroflexi bacterium]|nr:sigma-70 family RNA polymerase sigma factor [Chloroflexota bacterium]